MLGWAASFDLCSLTSTLGIGLQLVEHYGSERRSSFAFATARQVSACHAEAFGVGGFGVCVDQLLGGHSTPANSFGNCFGSTG